ncbi:Uncharacterized membrane protein YgdD, TMEM256/DUF423 family [Alteribacillus persepolensis]|uniref:Uncharacterized membrane protein YgdD, TMEM256/DUF423 family n=1 Tax=Alteribacillus persepolensis TaxID=568899 RepID=A0A1G8G694_9BACI|nr:DUF423 domain-containing protein [Alteribacillus persepolensis]SDH89924.1 Uncharacterized membrane protein YgdD, TMEM256/DUF423 family [Alteribacillus persepolensis]
MWKVFIILGALNAAAAVGFGAFGAHGLEGRLSERLMEVYQTAVQYHIMHALGLLAVGLVAAYAGATTSLSWSGWLLFFGIVVFSGSLYTMAFTGIGWLGAITPIGGTAFIAGWIMLVIAVLKM